MHRVKKLISAVTEPAPHDSPQKPLWTSRLTLVCVLIAVVCAGCWTVYREDRELRAQFRSEARVIALALDRHTIGVLAGGDANQAAKAYEQLKSQLIGIHRANSHNHAVFLLSRNAEGAVIVLTDSEPADSADYTPPGSVFNGGNSAVTRAVATGEETIAGPYRKGDGTWVSAVAPVIIQGGTIPPTALMITISSREWYRDLARESLETLALFLALLIPLAVYVLQRRKIEQTLIATDLEWHNTFDSMPDLIAVLDTEHRVVKANRAMREIMGRDERGIIDQHCFCHIHKTDAPPEFCPHSQLLRDGQPHSLEAYIPVLHGDYSVSVTPLRSPDGTLIGSIHFAHNVSHQRLAEEALRKSEEQHRNLFEKSSDAIFVAIPDGSILAANPAACRMFGMTENELRLVGRDRIIDHSDTRYQEAFETRARTGEFQGELNFVRNNGEVFPADISTNIFTDSEGNSRSMVRIRDISELKRLEHKLQESEERYRTLFNEVRIGIALADAATGIIIDCNQGLADIVKRPIEELIGNHQSILHPPAECTPFSPSFDQHRLNTDGVLMRDLLLTVDGEQREVEIKASMFTYRGREVILGSFNDVTERTRMETELNRKNAEIEQFIYTVSHDLRSPLVTVKTFLGFLDEDLRIRDDKRTENDMEHLHAAADRMESLLNELLDMSRIGRTGQPAADISYREILVESLDAVAGAITVGGVDIRIVDDNFDMHGDRQRLVQIWQNLLDNAIKYMGDQQNPYIEIGTSRIDGETVFHVCDNGIGISTEYHEKIFGIFEQLSREYGGVGMGLTMVRRIVELYGGRIWVESDGEGRGSCFKFTLPKAFKGHQE